MDKLSMIIASAVPLLVVVAALSRIGGKRGFMKGIGLQFIRFIVVTVSVPTIGVLALNDVVPSEAATGIIWATVGYAFGLRERTPKEADY